MIEIAKRKTLGMRGPVFYIGTAERGKKLLNWHAQSMRAIAVDGQR